MGSAYGLQACALTQPEEEFASNGFSSISRQANSSAQVSQVRIMSKILSTVAQFLAVLVVESLESK